MLKKVPMVTAQAVQGHVALVLGYSVLSGKMANSLQEKNTNLLICLWNDPWNSKTIEISGDSYFGTPFSRINKLLRIK